MNMIHRDKKTGIDTEISIASFKNSMRADERNVNACLEAIKQNFVIHTKTAIYRKGPNVPTET